METEAVLAWHFVGETLRDGRPIPADGEWLEHEGPITWCESGLYASRTVLDALGYATLSTLCRVECEQIQRVDADKFVCRKRRIVNRMDADDLLLEFARWCTTQVAHPLYCPPTLKQFLEDHRESLLGRNSRVTWVARAASVNAAWAAGAYLAAEDAWDAARAAQKDWLEQKALLLFGDRG